MAQPKLKIIWGASDVIVARWKLGLFGLFDRVTGKGRSTGVIVSLRGVLNWSAALAFVGYFVAAAALYLWLDRRPFNFVTYTDLINPARWSEVRALRGQAHIEEGLDDMRKQNWTEGVMKLRVGLSRYPQSIKGRLELAQFFLILNARQQALETLNGGLAYDYPGRNYIEAMCRIAAQAEDYDLWLRTTDKALGYLANRPRLTADRRWVVQQKLAALLAANRSDEAVKFAEQEGELESSMLSEFKLLALLKDGKPEEAIAFAERWRARVGTNPQVVRLQARAFREAGRFPEMDRAMEELRSLTPGDARPYVFMVVQLLLAGRTQEAATALDTFFFRFGSTLASLKLLADPLAEIGDAETLIKVIDRAREQGLDLRPLKQALLQAYMVKDNWVRAKATVMELRRDAPPSDDTENFWLSLVEYSAEAALDPSSGTQANLVNLVRDRQLPFKFYREIITAIRSAGRPETARELVTFAEGVYPGNATLEQWRRDLDAELAASRAAKAAEEAAGAVAGVSSSAGADVVFMRQLEAAVKDDQPKAIQMIRDVRRTSPPWLQAREADVLLLEISAHGRAGNALELAASARLYANGDRTRSAKLFTLARELYDGGRKAEAITVVKELLRKVPDYPPALRILEEWEPKPKPGVAPKSPSQAPASGTGG